MKNDVFCSATWTDINLDFENRTVRQCCKAETHSFPEVLTPEFISHNEFVTKRKIETIQNIRSKDCTHCWINYDKTGTAYRDSKNVWTIEKFIEKATGSTDNDQHVWYIEIKTDNICDMSCIYCSAYSSSKIAQEENSYVEKQYNQNDIRAFKEWINQFLSSRHEGTVLTFIFIGGESTASERFHDLAEYIEEQAKINTHVKIRLEICTNANSKRFLMDKFIDRINNSVVTWNIGISNESYGETAELVRYGLDWERFQSNFIKYVSLNNVERITLAVTLNVFNIKSFPEYIRWVHAQMKTYGSDKVFAWMNNFISAPGAMDIAILPEIYKNYINEAILAFQSEQDNPMFDQYNETIESLYNMKNRIGTLYKEDYQQVIQEFLEQKQKIKKTTKLIKLMDNIDL